MSNKKSTMVNQHLAQAEIQEITAWLYNNKNLINIKRLTNRKLQKYENT